MNTDYVCGKCGGRIICISTQEGETVTAHVFCEECDKEALESGKTKDIK